MTRSCEGSQSVSAVSLRGLRQAGDMSKEGDGKRDWDYSHTTSTPKDFRLVAPLFLAQFKTLYG